MPRPLAIMLSTFAIIFVIGQFLFVSKMHFGSFAWQIFLWPRIVFTSLVNTSSLLSELRLLRTENLSLSAQLFSAEHRAGIIAIGGVEYIKAPVYSEYPFNNAGTVVVAAGRSEGVSNGALALLAPKVFAGEIVDVFAHQATVRTVFDPGWELPVKIGDDRIDALLVGGRVPRLTLISKKRLPNQGAGVYLAAKKYPYGLQVGTMGALTEGSQNLFAEAELVVDRLPADVQEVFLANP